MSNNEQLFTAIIPRDEANLYGGRRGRDGFGSRSSQVEVNAEAVATVDLIGSTDDSSRSTTRTFSDAFVSENRILGRASSVVRVVL